jgi:hypothetical protein
MQLSPYQLHLGGIRTAVVEYRPLERTIDAVGRVSGSLNEASGSFRVELDLFDSDCEWLAVGQAAKIWTSTGIEPLPGRVESIGSLNSESRSRHVRVVASAPPDSVTEGQRSRVRVLCPAADAEPFRSQPVNVPPLREKEPRFAYTCPDHPDSIQTRPGRCPIDDQMLGKHALDVSERLRYWCRMHPNVSADEPGANCAECGGMELVARVISFRPAGQVLSIPETAIVDSGRRRVVFVERMAGEFEGIEVEIGPRCGDYFPVIRGLSRGTRVVAVGAFLLDAETRLNPSLAAGYFGATGKRSPLQSARDNSPLEGLTEADRAAALAQRDCPVTGKALGSMGTPVRQVVEGRVVFLCCAGCEGSLKANPGKYLVKLDAGTAKNRDTQPAVER